MRFSTPIQSFEISGIRPYGLPGYPSSQFGDGIFGHEFTFVAIAKVKSHKTFHNSKVVTPMPALEWKEVEYFHEARD